MPVPSYYKDNAFRRVCVCHHNLDVINSLLQTSVSNMVKIVLVSVSIEVFAFKSISVNHLYITVVRLNLVIDSCMQC